MPETRFNQIHIQTPEGVDFALDLAGPISRFLALAVDKAVIMGMITMLQTILGMLGMISEDFFVALLLVSYSAISIGYAMTLEWFWRGQTLGKRLLGLRVMDEQGLRLRPSQVIVRNLLRFIDHLPFFYMVGGIACLLSRRSQRLGDWVANTIVIRTPRLSQPDLSQIQFEKYNSLRQYPHLAARLRQNVSPAEATLALKALVRRDRLQPEARLEVFAQLAGHFHGVVKFPHEAIDGLSDERFVRDVVDILFRERKDISS